MKQCSKCKETKELSEFGKSSRHKDGYNGICKVCKNSNQRKHWNANKEKQNAKQRKRHHNDPRRNMLWQAKARAKKHGLPFDLTLEDIRIPAFCPALGTPIKVSNGRVNDASPSLDKIIPSKGYVKGNVQVISYKANRLKSNATIAEIKSLIYWLEEN